MRRIGIFKASTIVDALNWVGAPLISMYFYSMFIHPWIASHGDWDYVQRVWDRWQSLNVGVLAFAASLLAFNISRFNENRQQERDFIAARAFLPSALSELMDYLGKSATAFSIMKNPPGNTRIDHPGLPNGYREIFSNCIRHVDPAVGSLLSEILINLQVHDARLRDAISEFNGDGHAIDVYSLIPYLYRLSEIYSQVGRLFPVARAESDLDKSALQWEEYRNALLVLDIEIDDYFVDDKMNLAAFIKRQIERKSKVPGRSA